MNRTRPVIGYAWLAILGVLLACSAIINDRLTQRIEEYPFGCDSFGYLQSAQEIRQAEAARVWPRFNLESQHTRLLVEFMQSQRVPLERWEEIVAPHAHHYFPKSGLIGGQYPPGTGLLLSIFPQGEALHRLDRAVITLFLAAGLVVLIVAAVRQAWLTAGIVIFALHLGLEILGRIGNESFSINAVLAPLLLSILCLLVWLGKQDAGARGSVAMWLLAFLSGLFFGFAILARLPVLFLLPGALALLWPTEFRAWRKNGLIAFGTGFLLAGILPLAVFQSRLVGAWYLPTYGRDDAAPPTLEVFPANVSFYLGGGKGSTYNWALITVVVWCICLFWWPGQLRESKPGITCRRLALAALLMWGLPTVYFLTHKIAISYYCVPATFATVLLLAVGVFGMEAKRKPSDCEWGKGTRAIALLLLLLIPGLIVMRWLRRNYVPAAAAARPREFVLPAELADERAWIWGNMLTGTLWYYNRKPAYKIQFTGPDTRALLYEFVFKRGELQYLIRDDPNLQNVQDEILARGGALELRGEVDGYPYFLIHWPPHGPQ